MYDNDSGVAGIVVTLLIGAALIGGAFCWKFVANHVVGNKQIVDFNKQTFNVAVGDFDGDGKKETVRIKNWGDFDKSDTIQFTTDKGLVVYTHSSNVILRSE